MIEDNVIREVRAAREAFARLHGNDLWAMVEALREEDEAGDWPLARLTPRRRVEPATRIREGESPSSVIETREMIVTLD